MAANNLIRRGGGSTARRGRVSMIDDLWFKNAIFYCLSVGTYMDANGDGVGDFKGLLRRLDYLHGLGVTAIWLDPPFQPSPGKDDGYDIAWITTASIRATALLGDFVEFTHGCRQRRHSRHHRSRRQSHLGCPPLVSPKEPAARPIHRTATGMSGPTRSPASANKGMVFPGVQKSTWSHDKEARAWYFHRFYDFQPDLNTANPNVRAEIRKIMGFWLQLGVSGFRMDAVQPS